MKILFTTAATILICGFGSTQSLNPEVISSSGTHFSGDVAQLSWTLGECIILTHETSESVLTQGFHQTRLIITDVSEINLIDPGIDVYPNPTMDYVKLRMNNPMNEGVQFKLFDHSGRLLNSGQLIQDEAVIEMKGLASATYFLVVETPFIQLKTFKIVKLN